MDIVRLVLGIAWFLVPAYISNMTPPFLAIVIGKRLDYPADFWLTWRGNRVLGDHKTIRGFAGGAIMGVLMGLLQQRWASVPFFASIALVDYATAPMALLGFLLGFGALLGDSVKSFFKRRAGIPPGGKWVPFDQIDFVVGAFALGSFVAPQPWQVWLVALLAHPVIVIAFKHLGFYLRINDVKW